MGAKVGCAYTSAQGSVGQRRKSPDGAANVVPISSLSLPSNFVSTAAEIALYSLQLEQTSNLAEDVAGFE